MARNDVFAQFSPHMGDDSTALLTFTIILPSSLKYSPTHLKHTRFISYMVAPIPLKVISIYAKVHRLNEHIRILREDTHNFNVERAEKNKSDLITEITKLIELFDTKYPRIGRNFRDE